MKELETLNIVIQAQTQTFKKEIGKVNQSLGQMDKMVGGIQRKLLAGLSAAGVMFLTNNILKAVDALQVLSDKTGIGVERLQELQYMALQTGADINGLGISIRGFNEQIASGNSIFAQLGINTSNTEQAFNETLIVLSEMTNEAERARLGSQLLGRGFVQLMPIIAQGADGIRAYTEEARSIGAVMSRDTVEAIDRLGDSLALLTSAVAGAFRPILDVVVPALQRMVDWLIIATGFVNGIIQALFGLSTASNAVAGNTVKSNNAIIKSNGKLAKSYAGFDELNTVSQDTGGTSTEASGFDGFGEFDGDSLSASLELARTRMEDFNKAVQAGKKFWEDYGGAVLAATGFITLFWAAFSLPSWIGGLAVSSYFFEALYEKLHTLGDILLGGKEWLGKLWLNPLKPVIAIGAIAAAIAIAVLAFKDLYNTSEPFRLLVVKLFDKLSEMGKLIKGSLVNAFENLKAKIEDFGNKAYELYDKTIKPFVEIFATLAVNIAELMAGALGGALVVAIDLLGAAVGLVFDALTLLVDMVLDFIEALERGEEWAMILQAGLLVFLAPAIVSVASAIILSTASFIANTAALIANKVASIAVGTWQAILATKTWLLTTAQKALNAAYKANPIGAVIAVILLLISAFIYAYNNIEWFRNGIHAILNFLYNLFLTIIEGIGALFNWLMIFIKARFIDPFMLVFNGLIKFFTGIFTGDMNKAVQGLADVFSGVAQLITSPFGKAFNWVVDLWNNTIGKMSWRVPDWVPVIGGNRISAPKLTKFTSIPKLAQGGIVDEGQLFIAGEAGSELIGSHKGKQTVMPLENTDFVNAMRDAVLQGVVSGMSAQGSGGDVILTIDGMVLAKATEKNLNKLSTLQGGLKIAI